MPAYVERALFLVAPQNSGKSTTLRSMFLDRQLERGGEIPTERRIPLIHHLSNERHLYVRLTSPHETNESPIDFIEKCGDAMPQGRFCFACPFQVDAFKQMPGVVESVRLFRRAFSPERTRVAFLSPNYLNETISLLSPTANIDIIGDLHADGVEAIVIDVRRREANGLLLADFFDFT